VYLKRGVRKTSTQPTMIPAKSAGKVDREPPCQSNINVTHQNETTLEERGTWYATAVRDKDPVVG
jgi:hypothetical protein